MMFRCSQEYSHYQYNYNCIIPFDKLSGLWFILTQQPMGGNTCGKSGHLSIHFHFFEALSDAFEVQLLFRSSILQLIKDTDSM